MKEYMVGNATQMSDAETNTCSRIAPDYKVDENGLLDLCPRSSGSSEDCTEIIRVLLPELLPQDVLHHYHTSLEGGTKGSKEHTSGLDPISIGESDIEASNSMWASVWIVLLKRDYL